MTKLFSKSTLAVLLVVALTIVSILPGCGGTSTIVDKKVSIVGDVFGGEIRAFEIKPVQVMAGGQITVLPSIEQVTDGSGKLLGFAVTEQVVSRSGPFTIFVVITPDLCVKRADVVEYRAIHGRKVRSPKFTNQFTGKCAGDTIELDNGIDAVSGATLSCRAMTGGVRKALLKVKSVLGK